MLEVSELVSGLYSDQIVDELQKIADHYRDIKRSKPSYLDVPSSLHNVTGARKMSNPIVAVPEDIRSPIFKHLGITGEECLHGPLNHILARMITIPMMLEGYVNNYPAEEELKIYTDPPLLQMPQDEVKRIFEKYFARASEKLKDEKEFVKAFKVLGEIGQQVAEETENVYPANGSTQAYELFGIFHLFPDNRQVDLTATSPGVILPTEADPLRFKDSVVALKKNLLRPTYFQMLRFSIRPELGDNRRRRYSASREGTARNLQAYPQLAESAKDILATYLALGGRFEIRVGDQIPEMKLATLIGDIGIVYSVRDKEQKSKIAHNVTVINPEEAAKWRNVFDEQWKNGKPIDNRAVVDELLALKLD